MKKIYLFFILFGIINTYSQAIVTESKIDSVFYSLNNTENEYKEKLIELYYQSKQINYDKGLIRVLAKLAAYEDGSGGYAKSKEYIEELKPLALSNDEHEHYITACCLEAKFFFLDHNYNQATKVLNQAYKYLSKIKNIESRNRAKMDICIYKYWNFKYSESPKKSYRDSLLMVSKEIYSAALSLKNKNHRANRVLYATMYAASALIELNRLEEADAYLKISQKQLKYLDKVSFLIADYYEIKGDFEYKNMKKNKSYLDSALVNYNRANKISEETNYSHMTGKLLPKIALIYGDKKDVENQSIFLEKSLKFNKDLESKKNKSLNDLKNKIYKINSNENNEIEEFNYKKYTVILFCTIMGILISTLFYKKYYSSKRIILKNEISNIQSETDHENNLIPITNLVELLEKNDNSFYISFLKTYPFFADKLLKINPNIKPSDIEFCAYIKLNLNTKQIAIFKKISVRAVEGKKYRIRKKLNISVDENMYIWMSNL